MSGSVVTNDIPMEIVKVNACAAAASKWIAVVTPSSVLDLVVLVIDIEIKGGGIILLRCCPG
jgi:hypothetical protein